MLEVKDMESLKKNDVKQQDAFRLKTQITFLHFFFKKVLESEGVRATQKHHQLDQTPDWKTKNKKKHKQNQSNGENAQVFDFEVKKLTMALF